MSKTEAEKATGSTVRNKSATNRGTSSRKKATKSTRKTSVKTGVKKAIVKSAGRAKAVKKGKPKRRGFVAPKMPTIYDLHPMRKYIEMIVYECYVDRTSFEIETLSVRDLDSVKVTKVKLQTRIKTKKEILEVKKVISAKIMHDNHPDQKILMWDYLKNTELPKHIDLKYHFIPMSILNLLKTFQQRRIIEGYSVLGFLPEQIADVINRNPELIKISAEDVEVYQYFFWNLDSSGIMPIYPTQILADHILQLRAEVLTNWKKIVEVHKQANTWTKELEHDLCGTLYLNTPYYMSDNDQGYKLWTKIVFETNLTPLDSFRVIVAVSNGDISAARLNSLVQVSDYSVLNFDQQMQELSQHFVNAAEAIVMSNPLKAANIIKSGLLPTSQVMVLLNISRKGAGRNLEHRTRVYMSQADKLKKRVGQMRIDPYEDLEERKRQMLKDSEDAEFVDVPTTGEVGQS